MIRRSPEKTAGYLRPLDQRLPALEQHLAHVHARAHREHVEHQADLPPYPVTRVFSGEKEDGDAIRGIPEEVCVNEFELVLPTAVDVREGGTWKIRLLTAISITPPAHQSSTGAR